MPRAKRQRPAWLPAYVPFKDGRLLGLARQTILAWLSTILAMLFFLLTISYATERSRFSRLRFVHLSRSNTILVLRILSEAAGVFFAGTIHSTFEVVQWVLISRPDGVPFPQLLALHSSTGPLGLMVLALGKGLPAGQWPIKPRIMALLRLLAELAIPVLGVLVMSNVDTHAIYVPLPDTVQPFAVGMAPFNGSVASQLGVMEDLLFNLNYVTFLNNPLHAINLASASQRDDNCVKGLGLTANDSCAHNVLIAQELAFVEAGLPLQHFESSIVHSENQQVYFLQYTDNIEVSEKDLECETFRSGPAQYRLCLKVGDDGWLQATMTPCPADIIAEDKCSEDKRWKSSRGGFSTALKPSFLKAKISYDREDGRILSHELQTKPEPTTIDPIELLGAMKVILNTTAFDYGASPTNPILGKPSHFFGRFIAGHMYRISMIMKTNPNGRLKGDNALQALLGMTLFYCQNGILEHSILPYRPNATATRNGYSSGAFEKLDKTATVALAETQYRIKAGRATLIAYTALSGTTLLICLIALVVGSILELVKFEAEPTLWPALDFWSQCRVTDAKGKVISAYQRVELAWIYRGQELFKEVEGLRVSRRKRKVRGIEELELPTVGNR